MNNLLVIILAGGKSSRMKRDKALLPAPCGGTFLDHAINKADAFAPAECYVSGNYEGHPSLPDIIPHRGPLSGIHASIESAKSTIEYILFLPVDMPELTQSLLMKLWLNKDPDKDAIHFHMSTLPLLIKVSPRLKASIQSTLSNPTPSLWSIHSWLSQLSVCVLPEEKSILNMNINTPEEFLSWRQIREY